MTTTRTRTHTTQKKRPGLDLLWVILVLAAVLSFTSGGGATALAVFGFTSQYGHGARVALAVVGGLAGGLVSALPFWIACAVLDLLRDIADGRR